MAKLLAVIGTVSKKESSFSYELLNLFLEKYKAKNTNDTIEILDLNNVEMAKKSLNGENIGDFFNSEDSDKYIEQLKSVDKLVIVSPMHNFNISTLVKNYLDHILVANKTFSYKYSKKGDAIGLLDKLKVQILTTQGAPLGWYPFGNHSELLKGTFNFVGAKVLEPILLAGTKVEPLSGKSFKDAALSMSENIDKALESF